MADERTDQVAERFAELPSGDRFVLVSDRDPLPVRSYLAELAGVDEAAAVLAPVEVRQANPDTRVFEAPRP